eukprot:TRINITY_DN24_c0_g1_i1.p1 TRINITY_DN24_c0_g1~~TRINITY_DN24_c0_g1_i1.p1  ORF type:complete len:302 (+),score=97.75 TRINITY_DN24_c0_g1_i1:67-972(+)
MDLSTSDFPFSMDENDPLFPMKDDSEEDSSSSSDLLEKNEWNALPNTLNSFFAQEFSKFPEKKLPPTIIKETQINNKVKSRSPPDKEPKAATSKRKIDPEEKKERAKKAKKNPDEPKGPKNSYLFFIDHVRSKIKEENPKATAQELRAIMANLWKEMPEDKKKEFISKADVDKERYKREKEVYNATHKQETLPKEQEPPKLVEIEPIREPIIKKEVNVPEMKIRKGKKVILKIKLEGDSYYERVMLKDRTMSGLISKIEEKYPDRGTIIGILNVPDVAVTDDEGVKCLKDESSLVISVKKS